MSELYLLVDFDGRTHNRGEHGSFDVQEVVSTHHSWSEAFDAGTARGFRMTSAGDRIENHIVILNAPANEPPMGRGNIWES